MNDPHVNDEVRGLKASAKDARDAREWDLAIDDLQEALSLLVDEEPIDGRPLPDALAAEIADTYGMIGGIERRRGLAAHGTERAERLRASLKAYDRGYRYENDLSPATATTYNLINLVVAEVLVEPSVLSEPSETFAEHVAAAKEALDVQLDSTRMRDPWAYCDLLTVRLLAADQPVDDVLNTLRGLRPPQFVYRSVLQTLEPLAGVAATERPEVPRVVRALRTVVDT